MAISIYRLESYLSDLSENISGMHVDLLYLELICKKLSECGLDATSVARKALGYDLRKKFESEFALAVNYHRIIDDLKGGRLLKDDPDRDIVLYDLPIKAEESRCWEDVGDVLRGALISEFGEAAKRVYKETVDNEYFFPFCPEYFKVGKALRAV